MENEEKVCQEHQNKTGELFKTDCSVSAKATLSADDIDYLKKNTRYDEQEIKEWYRCLYIFDEFWVTAVMKALSPTIWQRR